MGLTLYTGGTFDLFHAGHVAFLQKARGAAAAEAVAADAAVEATEAAQISFGGFGYAKEYHVERLVREALLFRIVPVTPQMLLSFIAEKALGLPKSY